MRMLSKTQARVPHKAAPAHTARIHVVQSPAAHSDTPEAQVLWSDAVQDPLLRKVILDKSALT